MKKKIGELTLREVQKICKTKEQCSDCPVYKVCAVPLCREDEVNEYLEKEIEVEENEKN